MISTTAIYVNNKGGFIFCLPLNDVRIFTSCAGGYCVYSSNLHQAKFELDNLDSKKALLVPCDFNISNQRKTTLKWNSDGDLSPIDMTRILNLLSQEELTSCELACVRSRTSF
tara:strand:+ start:332 stop:670 length:339 start_codon:yes stop_codon:yes gene_type:complete